MQTSVGNHTAAVDQVSTGVDGLKAEYVMRASAGGVVGGTVIGADAGDGRGAGVQQ
ncbi:hypothetical protein [Tritonibacter scottomollicae]|uniref:hypothetical protein n=1 Tax=Tritonibacter scottomollicae TaxID=483013 RepID=UPI003AA99A02